LQSPPDHDLRNRAYKNFLLSVGVCEITYTDIEAFKLQTKNIQYAFMAAPLCYVLLPEEIFLQFKMITDSVGLDAAQMKNGVIGILQSVKK
jgi:hypothetical protein